MIGMMDDYAYCYVMLTGQYWLVYEHGLFCGPKWRFWLQGSYCNSFAGMELEMRRFKSSAYVYMLWERYWSMGRGG